MALTGFTGALASRDLPLLLSIPTWKFLSLASLRTLDHRQPPLHPSPSSPALNRHPELHSLSYFLGKPLHPCDSVSESWLL